VDVKRIEVQTMLDGVDFKAGGLPFGLVRNDGSLRPAFFAYKTVVNLFTGVTSGSWRPDLATGIYTVVLHKPGAVITVVWDQKPVATTATVPALHATAALYDKFGKLSTIQAKNGVFTLPLEPATDNSDNADPNDYVVGGSPLILVQAVN
jgi:hypothetical protein